MKNRLLLAFIFCIPFFAKAQINLTAQLPGDGVLLKDQLWNVIITNNSNDIAEVKLQVDVRDVLLGQSVINVVSGKMLLGKGVKIVTVRDVQPLIYNYMATEYAANYLPCGSYTINYRLVQETTKGDVPVADDVVRLNVAPLSPPLLTTPADKSDIENTYPQFAWMPPAPMQMFNPLLYDITVVMVEEGQSPKQAMEFNRPAYINSNISHASEKMPTSFEQLQKGKKYAWQVVARSGTACIAVSEVWQFTVGKMPDINYIVEQTPYTKMKKDNPDKGVAPNSILKISYINETTEKTATVQISNQNNPGNILCEFKIKLQPGENLVKYDLKKLFSPQQGTVYQAQIVNERKEKWLMQFECYQYGEQNNRNK